MLYDILEVIEERAAVDKPLVVVVGKKIETYMVCSVCKRHAMKIYVKKQILKHIKINLGYAVIVERKTR